MEYTEENNLYLYSVVQKQRTSIPSERNNHHGDYQDVENSHLYGEERNELEIAF
jgi:hypothetical protein